MEPSRHKFYIQQCYFLIPVYAGHCIRKYCLLCVLCPFCNYFGCIFFCFYQMIFKHLPFMSLYNAFNNGIVMFVKNALSYLSAQLSRSLFIDRKDNYPLNRLVKTVYHSQIGTAVFCMQVVFQFTHHILLRDTACLDRHSRRFFNHYDVFIFI